MTALRALLLAATASALKVPTRRELLAGAASSVAAPAFADPREFTPSVVEEEFSTGKTGLLLLPPVAPLRNSYTWVRAAEDDERSRYSNICTGLNSALGLDGEEEEVEVSC